MITKLLIMFFKSKRLKDLEFLFSSITAQLEKDQNLNKKFLNKFEKIEPIISSKQPSLLKDKNDLKKFADSLGNEALLMRDNNSIKSEDIIAESNVYVILSMFYELSSMKGKGVEEAFYKIDTFIKNQKKIIQKIIKKRNDIDQIVNRQKKIDYKVNEIKIKKELLDKLKFYLLKQYPDKNKTDNEIVELLDYIPLDYFALGYIGKFIDISLYNEIKEYNLSINDSELIFSELLESFFYNQGDEGVELLKIFNMNLIGSSISFDSFKELNLRIKYEQVTGKGSMKTFLWGCFCAYQDYRNLNGSASIVPGSLFEKFNIPNSNVKMSTLIENIERYGEKEIMFKMLFKTVGVIA